MTRNLDAGRTKISITNGRDGQFPMNQESKREAMRTGPTITNFIAVFTTMMNLRPVL